MPLPPASDSAFNSGFAAGQTYGAVFWIVVLAFFAYRRARSMKEAGANRKGHAAALLLYGTWCASFAMAALLGHQQIIAGLCVGLAGFAALVLGVFLAIGGLLEIRAEPVRYTSGRGPAVRALVSAGLFCAVFAFGFWLGFNRVRGRGNGGADAFSFRPPGYIASSASTPIERSDLNFRMTPPPRPWVQMDAKRINADAAVAFARADPEIYFLVIAEKLGAVEVTPEAAIETWKARIESLSAQSTFVAPHPTQVNGLPGLRAGATAKLGALELAYVNTVIAHNGFVYQLLAWSAVRNEGRLNREADALFANFRLIDPTLRAAESRKPAQTFTSRDYGYTIDPEGAPWVEWRALPDKFPDAEFGALCGEHAAMAISPMPLLGWKPSVAEADAALVKLMDFDATKAVQHVAIQRGGWRGFRATYERASSQGKNYRYEVLTFLGPVSAILAAEWRSIDEPPRECPYTLEKLVLGDAPAVPKEKVPRAAAAAHFFNELGLIAFRAGDFARARSAFEQAHALAPDSQVYVTNVVGTLKREGRKDVALQWLVKELKGAECSSPLRATEASLLADLGKVAEALATWSSVFGCGYLDDSAFDEYARFLEAHGKASLAVNEAERYAARQDSVDIALLRAELLSRKGERDKAVALLEERQKQKGFDVNVAYRLAELALDAERPAEAGRVCEEMVSRGYASKNVRVLQARAEYRLKWYARAKSSLELALKLDPADREVQRFLDHVSAMLGEGKNSAIKDPIDPVPLPAALADGAGDPGDRGHSAVYLLRATAISFRRGKDLRTSEYRRIRVVDETGVSRFSTMDFQFDPLSEALYVNKLEVKDASGAVTTSTPSEAYVSDDANAELATQRRTLFIPIPGLRPGSTIELILTRKDLVPADRFEFSENRLSIPYPVGRSALFLTGDTGQVESRATAGVASKPVGDGIAWVIESPPVYRWEPLQPPVEDFLPTVWLGNSSSTWQTVGHDYLHGIDKLLGPDKAVRETARKLEKSPAALERFVQKTLTYKAIEFGRGARVPRAPAEVLRHRYGDCKDHALLLYHLLRNSGVDAQLALVRTGSPVRVELPSLDQFDHMVVYLPANRTFVDPTDKTADLARGVTPAIAGRDALVLDPKQPRLMRIPDQGDDAGDMTLARDARVVGGADLEVTETVTFRGNEAAAMRAYFDDVEPKARPQALQRRLSGNGHSVEVLSLDVRDLREPQKPLTVQVKYVERGAFHAVGSQLVGKLPAVLERHRIEVDREERETPFQFRLPLSIRSAISLQLPSGYAPAQPLPHRASSDGPFAAWKMTPDDAASGRVVGARFEYDRKRGRHAASEFADLRRDSEAALGALEQEIVLQPVALGSSR